MNKMIIIVGPTASGKSDLAIKIASHFNLEIINADAFQVYKELNAGVNKPTADELKLIKHHFINNKSINQEWNIKLFQNEINNLISLNPNKNYVICGGSNLYIDAIIKNYNLGEIDNSISFDNMSNEQLWDKLNQLDSDEAKKISVNNPKRIKQALRIIFSSKMKKSEKDLLNNQCNFEYILISTKLDREKIYQKINSRVYQMIDMNWKQEVIDLLKNNNNFDNNNALKAIGYKEVYESIINNTDIDIAKIQQKTRNYAKRQLTWIKNKFNVNYEYDVENNNVDYIFEKCKEFLDGK